MLQIKKLHATADAPTTRFHDIWSVGDDWIVETCCQTVWDEETKGIRKTDIGGGVGGCLAVDIREQSQPEGVVANILIKRSDSTQPESLISPFR